MTAFPALQALDAGLDQALTTALLLLAVVALARPVATAALLTAALLPGRLGAGAGRLGLVVAPLLLRRALLARGAAMSGGLAAALAGPAAGPVLAQPGVADVEAGASSGTSSDAGTGTAGREGRATTLPDLDRGATAALAPPGTSTYLVRPGDCLWRIAARHLPAGADAAVVDAAWRRWFRLNRGVIGPDPDLIDVGLRLRVPTRLPVAGSGAEVPR